MKRKPSENGKVTGSDEADWMEPFKLPGKRIEINAGLIDVKSFVEESPYPLIAAHTTLTLTNASDLMREGARLQTGRRQGGRKAAAAVRDSASKWQQQCTDKARALLSQGRSLRELAGILASQFGRDPSTIRRVLKKAGVK